MRREEQHKCIQCNATLPWRYKGRQKIYCSDTCRKEYTKNKKKVKSLRDKYFLALHLQVMDLNVS